MELLTKVQASEHDLHALGFSDFRIRLIGITPHPGAGKPD
jgi:hypothetical protein